MHACITCSISLLQVCICSSLHWKEFKPFSSCCPFAIKASTWNRNKVYNGFRTTCFSQIPKNGNNSSSSLWWRGGLRILWEKGAFEEPAGCLHCLLLMPEFISWSLSTENEVVGRQWVKHPRLSDIMTKTRQKFLQAIQEHAVCDTGGYPWQGHVFAHTHFSRETVTPPPKVKAVLQVLVLDLYQPKANSFSFVGNNPQSLYRPRSALEQRFHENLLAVLLIGFLACLLGSNTVWDDGFTSAHHCQLGKEDSLLFQQNKGFSSQLWNWEQSSYKVKWSNKIQLHIVFNQILSVSEPQLKQ